MARRKHASMCERSAAVAANLIKASTLALAKAALAKARSAARLSTRRPGAGARDVAPLPPPVDYARAMRLVEPDTTRTAAYVVVDDEGDGVDRRAAAYIMKVRAMHRSDIGAAGSEAADCVPPPPTSKLVF